MAPCCILHEICSQRLHVFAGWKELDKGRTSSSPREWKFLSFVRPPFRHSSQFHLISFVSQSLVSLHQQSTPESGRSKDKKKEVSIRLLHRQSDTCAHHMTWLSHDSCKIDLIVVATSPFTFRKRHSAFRRRLKKSMSKYFSVSRKNSIMESSFMRSELW